MIASNNLSRRFSRLEEMHCLRRERELREQWLRNIIDQRAQQALAEACPDAEEVLIHRFWQAGFSAHSLPALGLAPLTVVAWASGSVSSPERQNVLLAVVQSEVAENRTAVNQVRAWLQRRPSVELMELWEAYTQVRRQGVADSDWHREGQELLAQASAIALASGGVLGFGKICAEEQAVLDRIRRCYTSPAD